MGNETDQLQLQRQQHEIKFKQEEQQTTQQKMKEVPSELLEDAHAAAVAQTMERAMKGAHGEYLRREDIPGTTDIANAEELVKNGFQHMTLNDSDRMKQEQKVRESMM